MSTQSSMDTPPSLSINTRRNQSAPSLTNCTSHRERFSSLARGSESSQTRWATFPFFFGAGLMRFTLSRPRGRLFLFILISKQKSGSPHSFIILPYTLLIIAPQSRKIKGFSRFSPHLAGQTALPKRRTLPPFPQGPPLQRKTVPSVGAPRDLPGVQPPQTLHPSLPPSKAALSRGPRPA